MQRGSKQPACAHLQSAGRVLWRRLLLVYVWLGGAPRLRSVLARLALGSACLRRLGRVRFNVFPVPADRVHPCLLHLLSRLRGHDRSSPLRGPLPFQSAPIGLAPAALGRPARHQMQAGIHASPAIRTAHEGICRASLAGGALRWPDAPIESRKGFASLRASKLSQLRNPGPNSDFDTARGVNLAPNTPMVAERCGLLNRVAALRKSSHLEPQTAELSAHIRILPYQPTAGARAF